MSKKKLNELLKDSLVEMRLTEEEPIEVDSSEGLEENPMFIKESINPKFSENLSLEELTFGMRSANLISEGETVLSFVEKDVAYVAVTSLYRKVVAMK